MKATLPLVLAALFAAAAPGAMTALAQAPADHGKMDHGHAGAMKPAQPNDVTDGEIRKIDKAAGKVTIKHADIKNLDMPAMTMVFQATDKALLDRIQVGDKVKFKAASDNGKLMVTDIQPAQ